MITMLLITHETGKNIWKNVKKISKIGHDQKTLRSTFAKLLVAITKVSICFEERLGTRFLVLSCSANCLCKVYCTKYQGAISSLLFDLL